MLDSEDFAALTGPFRAELLAHCYRMLGSVQDAEDQLQETLIRAWRSYGEFEGRSSLRTWLYRIATNACLRALENGSRRPLPSGLGAPLILRDVLQWRAAEVAELLGTTAIAVNGMLQRARATLSEAAPAEDDIHEPASADDRALADRYAAAFENADVAALTELLRSDAVLEMPPLLTWFSGRAAVLAFLQAQVLLEPGAFRLLPTSANGQPAFAAYLRGADGVHRAHGIVVLTIAASRVARAIMFMDPDLLATFGMPPVLPGAPGDRTVAPGEGPDGTLAPGR